MTPRKLRADDIPALKAMEGDYPYPDLCDAMIECVVVVEDETGQPVAAVAAKRLVEIYCWMDSSLPAPAKARALRVMHGAMPGMLRARGYTHSECFLPPSIAARFGRRLMKSFGWARNWASWTREL